VETHLSAIYSVICHVKQSFEQFKDFKYDYYRRFGLIKAAARRDLFASQGPRVLP